MFVLVFCENGVCDSESKSQRKEGFPFKVAVEFLNELYTQVCKDVFEQLIGVHGVLFVFKCYFSVLLAIYEKSLYICSLINGWRAELA